MPGLSEAESRLSDGDFVACSRAMRIVFAQAGLKIDQGHRQITSRFGFRQRLGSPDGIISSGGIIRGKFSDAFTFKVVLLKVAQPQNFTPARKRRETRG